MKHLFNHRVQTLEKRKELNIKMSKMNGRMDPVKDHGMKATAC